MKRIRVKDIEIAYNISGEGDPVILIGGFTMTKESWGLQEAAMSKHLRVITFDNRGAGQTVISSESFTVADMAADTIGLMNALGIDTAHIFGVSMGGLISQILLLDYPDRIKKAVLGCTTHGGRHAVQAENEVMALLGEAADPAIPAEKAVRRRVPILFAEQFIRDEPEKLEGFIRLSIRHWPTPEGASGQMKALSVFNSKRRLGEIRRPVLVITGDEDRMMPPENSRLLADAIPGSELYIVDGAGHSFYQEKPDEVNRVLIDFFMKKNS